MKSAFKHALLGGVCFALLGSVQVTLAAPSPPELMPGPVSVKFDGRQQLSPEGAITLPDGQATGESAWGLINVSTVATGIVEGGGITRDEAYWTANSVNGGIRGMFYDLEPTTDSSGGIASTGGRMDLYFFEDFRNVDGTSPDSRTALDRYPEFGDPDNGIHLVSIRFADGLSDENTTILGDTLPVAGGFTGQSGGFGTVDVDAGGLWANQFEAFFSTDYGDRDYRLRSNYENFSNWDTTGVDGQTVFGSTLDDPLTGYVIPAPSSVLLMGLGLLGFGVLYGGPLRHARSGTRLFGLMAGASPSPVR